MVAAGKALISALLCLLAGALFPQLLTADSWWRDWTSIAPRPALSDAARDIVLVEIRDDAAHRAALTSLLPTDRDFVGRVAVCLAEARPKALGIDILLADERDAVHTQPLLLNRLQHAARAAPLVLASYDVETPQGPIAYPPISALAAAAGAAQGNVRLLTDKTSERVRFSLPSASGDPIAFSFADALARVAQHAPAAGRSVRERILWGSADEFLRVRAVDVARLCEQGDASALRALAEGKILLFGSVAQADRHRTPLANLGGDGQDGLTIHGAIVAQRLADLHVHEAGLALNLFLAFLVALVAVAVPPDYRWNHIPIEALAIAAIFIADLLLFFLFDVAIRSGLVLLSYAFGIAIWITGRKLTRLRWGGNHAEADG